MAGSGALLCPASGTRAASVASSALNITGDSLTIEFWYRGWASDAGNYAVSHSAADTSGWAVRADGTSHFQFAYSNGSAMVNGPIFPAASSDNVWHHYAIVKSPTGITNYYDGTQVATNATGAGVSLLGSGAAFQLNARAGATGGGLGMYSEVRLWNVARTGAEIAAARTARITTAQAGLVAVWPCSEDTGTTAGGVVGGVGLTLTGGIWTYPPSPYAGGGGGSGGDPATNNDLAAWLSASDGTHLDSAPIRTDLKLDHDGVTLDAKLFNLAGQLTLNQEGVMTQLAIITGNTAPPPGQAVVTNNQLSEQGTAEHNQLAVFIGAENGTLGMNMWETAEYVIRQLSGHEEYESDTGEIFPWSITGEVNAHTDAQVAGVVTALETLSGAVAAFFETTNALITATGEATTAATTEAVNAHTDAATVLLQGDMNDHEAAVNAHTTFEADRLAAAIEAEGDAAHADLESAVDAINAHTTDVGTAISAVTVAEAVLVTQAVNNVAPAVNSHTTSEADRIIAAMPTDGGGGGTSDTAAINAHTTAEANRVIANNDAQTVILGILQTALAALTLTVNTILEKVQDMVDQLTNVTGMLQFIIGWINGQPGGGGTPTLVGSTAFNGTTYWPLSADYYEIEVTAWPKNITAGPIPGGEHFRHVGWYALRAGECYEYGQPLSFTKQRTQASAIVPSGLLVGVPQGVTGNVRAFAYA